MGVEDGENGCLVDNEKVLKAPRVMREAGDTGLLSDKHRDPPPAPSLPPLLNAVL